MTDTAGFSGASFADAVADDKIDVADGKAFVELMAGRTEFDCVMTASAVYATKINDRG